MLKDWHLFDDKKPKSGEYVLVSSRGCMFAIIKWPNYHEDMRFVDMATGGSEDILQLDSWISINDLQKYTKNESADHWYGENENAYITVPYHIISDLKCCIDGINDKNLHNEEEIDFLIKKSQQLIHQLIVANPYEKGE